MKFLSMLPYAGDEEEHLSALKFNNHEDTAAKAVAKALTRCKDIDTDNGAAHGEIGGGHVEASSLNPSLITPCEPSKAVSSSCTEVLVEGSPQLQGLVPNKISKTPRWKVVTAAACTCVGVYCAVLALGELAWHFGPFPEDFQ